MKKNKSPKKKIIIESSDSENTLLEKGKDPCNANLELDYQTQPSRYPELVVHAAGGE
jgi:hypothetical protein